MSSVFGTHIKLSLFGQSHSPAVGFVLDGLPAGFTVNFEQLKEFCDRRRPVAAFSTTRRESDEPEFLSGLVDGVTCGAPLCAVIKNSDINKNDYQAIKDTPRPGHADYTAFVKSGGYGDKTGGGHLSGRLTAALCLAGGICKQILQSKNISIAAHIKSIGNVCDTCFNSVTVSKADFDRLHLLPITVIDINAGKQMEKAITDAANSGDSLGGVIECAVIGLPAGIGEPVFGGLENIISSAVFAIPAVKGIEFGLGFASAELTGSQNNDEFCTSGGSIVTKTNNCGGILGGISNGMPLIFSAAIKPTPSIALPQKTVNTATGANADISVTGRHDACIVPRAVPCVEAAAAIALLDALYKEI